MNPWLVYTCNPKDQIVMRLLPPSKPTATPSTRRVCSVEIFTDEIWVHSNNVVVQDEDTAIQLGRQGWQCIPVKRNSSKEFRQKVVCAILIADYEMSFAASDERISSATNNFTADQTAHSLRWPAQLIFKWGQSQPVNERSECINYLMPSVNFPLHRWPIN